MTAGGTGRRTLLADRVVVVPGGTGFLGSRVAGALVGAGARVVVPTRGGRRAGDAPFPGEGVPLPGGPALRTVVTADWADPVELTGLLAEPGWTPDAVVAAIGGWWIGPPLSTLDVATWRSLVESHLTAHFLALRGLLGRLTGPDPVYVTLNGSASREPMAGSGPISVTGAGQRMLLDVARSEQAAGSGRVRLHEVLVTAAVTGDDRNLVPVAQVPAERVVAAVLSVLVDPAAPPVVEVNP